MCNNSNKSYCLIWQIWLAANWRTNTLRMLKIGTGQKNRGLWGRECGQRSSILGADQKDRGLWERECGQRSSILGADQKNRGLWGRECGQRSSILGADQKDRGLWEREWDSNQRYWAVLLRGISYRFSNPWIYFKSWLPCIRHMEPWSWLSLIWIWNWTRGHWLLRTSPPSWSYSRFRRTRPPSFYIWRWTLVGRGY